VTKPEPDHSLEDDLTAWGKTIVLESVGRASGRPRRVTLGFIAEDSGAILIAASEDTSRWARNLLAEPRCHVERDGSRVPSYAARLSSEESHAVVARLILKYGTPSERLGGGPAFRVSPRADDGVDTRSRGSDYTSPIARTRSR
jgi:deazaflavin-dependent oxidoreductase (nitroreductase family)